MKRLLRCLLDYWTSPDRNPWLKAQRDSLEEFERNHPHIRIKDVNSAADNTATTNYKPERHHD